MDVYICISNKEETPQSTERNVWIKPAGWNSQWMLIHLCLLRADPIQPLEQRIVGRLAVLRWWWWSPPSLSRLEKEVGRMLRTNPLKRRAVAMTVSRQQQCRVLQQWAKSVGDHFIKWWQNLGTFEPRSAVLQPLDQCSRFSQVSRAFRGCMLMTYLLLFINLTARIWA